MKSDLTRTPISIRFRPHERRLIEAAADAAQMRKSEFVRAAALQAARDQLAGPQRPQAA